MYQGYIKDYEGATLMHCELNPRIVYTQFTSVVRKQKEVYYVLCNYRITLLETIPNFLDFENKIVVDNKYCHNYFF